MRWYQNKRAFSNYCVNCVLGADGIFCACVYTCIDLCKRQIAKCKNTYSINNIILQTLKVYKF